MLSLVSILTTPSKLNIVELLNTPKTPDDIALQLKVTRQAVDKQLKELQAYGIVEKKWFIGYNRPRVEFHITELGERFYKGQREFMANFRQDGKNWLTDKLKVLDIDLMNGRISAEKYREQKAGTKSTLKWFTGTD